MAINWWFITAFIGFWRGWRFTVIKLIIMKTEYEREREKDMEEYKKMNPSDPYCNFYVPGWQDGSYQIGDWIFSHHS